MENNKLLTNNISKLFVSYSIPTVLSMITFSLYVLADTIFVGIGAGHEALAAFNIAIPIFTLYSSIGLIFGVGGSTTMSIFLGSGDDSKNNNIFSMSAYLSLLIGIFISIIGNMNIEFIARILGADDSIIELTKTYIMPINGLAFANIFSNCIQIFIRNDLNPKLVTIATITSNIINIIGDYILIFIFDMGILGASIPTAIAPLIACSIMMLHFTKKDKNIKFILKIKEYHLILRCIKNGLGAFFMEITSGVSIYIFNLHFTKKDKNIKFILKIKEYHLILRCIKNGLGAFFMEITSGVSIYIFNFIIIKTVGAIGVSIYAIISNITYVFKYLFMGIAQAIQPIISINYGANKMDRVKKTLNIALIVSISVSIIFYIIIISVSIIFYIIIFLFSKQIVQLFISNSTNDILNMGITALKIYFINLPFSAINIILIYYFQSIEQTRLSSMISFLRSLIFIIINIIILYKLFLLNGIWSSVIFAEIMTIIVIFFVNKYIKNKNNI